MTFHLTCVHIFSSVSVLATFWEIAAHSVDHMFSFVFLLFVISVISHFDFEGWIWILIASVPDLCILCTFKPLVMLSITVLRRCSWYGSSRTNFNYRLYIIQSV